MAVRDLAGISKLTFRRIPADTRSPYEKDTLSKVRRPSAM